MPEVFDITKVNQSNSIRRQDCIVMKTMLRFYSVLTLTFYTPQSPVHSFKESRDMGLLPNTWNCVLGMRRECREPFFPTNVGKRSRHASRHVRHARAVIHARSLTSGFLWSRWQGKRSPHSRHMRNPKFYVSDKRPMDTICHVTCRSRLIVKEMCFWEFLYFV